LNVCGKSDILTENPASNPSSQDSGDTAITLSRSPAAAPVRLHVPEQGSLVFLTWICFVASLGGFLFGFDTAVISGTIEFVEKQFALTKVEVGWFGSAALMGCIIGALFAGSVGDRFGRKPSLILAGVFYFVSALYSAIPPTFAVLVWARALGGLGVGMASVLGPMYISEFSPARLRGRIVALYQLSIALGILIAYLSNYLLLGVSQSTPAPFGDGGFLHYTIVAEVWRGMFGAEMIPAALFTLLLFSVPESPRWLVKAGRIGKAFAVLARVDGRQTAEPELQEIQRSVVGKQGSWKELFAPGLRRALLVGIGLSFFGQLTGVNVVVYYGPVIMRDVGLEMGNALFYQIALGVINLGFTLLAIWKIDSWGRRPLLIGGMALVAVSMAITAILVVLQAPPIWVIVLLGLYIAFLAVSICAVIWVLTPEIFPNRIRGRGASISTFVNWTTNAFSAFAFPWYVAAYGLGTGFFTFAVICLIATVFFWKLVPETRGKTLEEIEEFWKPQK
jgi:SP family arabinose:H+ symporter-like MFS transporter